MFVWLRWLKSASAASLSLKSDNSIAKCFSLEEDLFATLELKPKLAPGGIGVPMCVMRGEGFPNIGGGNVVGIGGSWGRICAAFKNVSKNKKPIMYLWLIMSQHMMVCKMAKLFCNYLPIFKCYAYIVLQLITFWVTHIMCAPEDAAM